MEAVQADLARMKAELLAAEDAYERWATTHLVYGYLYGLFTGMFAAYVVLMP